MISVKPYTIDETNKPHVKFESQLELRISKFGAFSLPHPVILCRNFTPPGAEPELDFTRKIESISVQHSLREHNAKWRHRSAKSGGDTSGGEAIWW